MLWNLKVKIKKKQREKDSEEIQKIEVEDTIIQNKHIDIIDSLMINNDDTTYVNK